MLDSFNFSIGQITFILERRLILFIVFKNPFQMAKRNYEKNSSTMNKVQKNRNKRKGPCFGNGLGNVKKLWKM